MFPKVFLSHIAKLEDTFAVIICVKDKFVQPSLMQYYQNIRTTMSNLLILIWFTIFVLPNLAIPPQTSAPLLCFHRNWKFEELEKLNWNNQENLGMVKLLSLSKIFSQLSKKISPVYSYISPSKISFPLSKLPLPPSNVLFLPSKISSLKFLSPKMLFLLLKLLSSSLSLSLSLCETIMEMK